MSNPKRSLVFVGGSAVTELLRVLEEYLSVLLGLTKKGFRTNPLCNSLIFLFLSWKVNDVHISNRIWAGRIGGIQVEIS